MSPKASNNAPAVLASVDLGQSTAIKGRPEADDVVCLEDHEFFGAIGYYYRDFGQISDEEVIKILERFPVKKPEPAPPGPA